MYGLTPEMDRESGAGVNIVALGFCDQPDPLPQEKLNEHTVRGARRPRRTRGASSCIHHCLGAPLARLEGRIALTSLLERYPQLRFAVPPEQLTYQPSFIFHGLKTLPVTLS
jgi:cytochrome P450